MVSWWRDYAGIVRSGVACRAGSFTFAAVGLLYMGLYLWLSGMLTYNSRLNFSLGTPKVYYALNPKVMLPYLIFIPTPDSLLFVNLTGAVVTVLLSGLVGLNAALLVVYAWRRNLQRGRRGAGLFLGLLPTLVPNLGLGCCPTLPLLLTLMPSSIVGFGLLLRSRYTLMMGASVALMMAATLFTIEMIRRANPYESCQVGAPQ